MADGSNGTPKERILLPTALTPIHYRLYVTPNLNEANFSGKVSIDVMVNESAAQVTLHALQLKISSASFISSVGTISATSIEMDETPRAQTATLIFGQNDVILPGAENARLELSFTGILNNDMDGFYKSTYKVNGENRTMAVTQFEATGARRAFPCWDEPAHKATFDVTLTIPSDHQCLSNVLPKSTTEDPAAGTTTVAYNTTLKMSTYLLAFAVFRDFEFVEAKTKKGVPTRVWSPPGKRNDGKFALEVSCKVLDLFSDYFGIDYPLPKVDHIAYPDFAAGAMENWGLITYRETALLIDAEASVSQKQRVANVVAHELAHQWFGNLVTMQWWDNLWLNEAFATYIASMAVHELFPEWDEWLSFVCGSVASGMDLDSLDSSHPVQVEVTSADEVMQIFDAISYHKGSAILRHIWGELGADNFRDGLRVYLKRHSFENTVAEDLFSAWSEVSGKDMGKMMDAFIHTTGYPLLTVEPSTNAGEFRFTQARFHASGIRKDNEQLWSIPLRPACGSAGFKKTSATPESLFLDSAESVLVIPGAAEAPWIKFNRDQTGFYRIRYSEAMWQNLLPPLRAQEIPAIDRVGIVSDVAALSFSCLQPTARLLELSQMLVDGKEAEPEVVRNAVSSLNRALVKWGTQDTYKQLADFVCRITRQFVDRIGLEPQDGEKDVVRQLRASLLSTLVSAGDPSTSEYMREQFQRWSEHPSSVASDLRPVCFQAEVMLGGLSGYEQVQKVYEDQTVHAVKLQALRALGTSPDMNLVRRVLEYALSDAVKSQDFFYAVANVGGMSAQHAQFLWDLYKEHWEAIDEKLGSGMSMQKYAVAYGVQGLTTDEQADDVEQFFKGKNTDKFASQLAQSLEKIRATANWVRFNESDLKAYVESI